MAEIIESGAGAGALGGLGTGFIGGIIGGALFGGDGLGRRNGGDTMVQNTVDTVALLQANHANALQTSNQTIDLLRENARIQGEVLTNRFETERGQARLSREISDTQCLIRTTEANTIIRGQAERIRQLELEQQEMRTRATILITNANTRNALNVAVPAAAAVPDIIAPPIIF